MLEIKKLSLMLSLAIALAACSPVKQDADIGVLAEPLLYFVNPSQAIDGDSFIVLDLDDFRKEITVNLCGIQASGIDEDGGIEAREALIDLLAETAPHHTLYIVARDDFSGTEYDHAEVFYLGEVDGEEQDIFVNAEMVRLGHATINPETIDECLNRYLIPGFDENT